MKLRHVALLALAILVSGVPVFAGGGSEGGASSGGAKAFRLSWAPAYDEKHGLTQAGIQANAKIKELSGGKISFDFFPGSQLGNEREVFESVQLGTIDSAFMSSPVVSGFSDVLDGFDMPYLCDNDMDLYQEIVNSGIGAAMFEKLKAATGVVGISYLINPGRDFYLNTPFKTLNDAKGVKLRSMESPLHLATYQALGFNPTPMAYSEIYQAMKNGTIDGFEDVSVSVRSQKNYEVAKHVVISGHMTAAPVFIMSQNAWNSLSKEEQAWILQAGIAAQEATKVTYQEQTPLTIEFMKQQGLTVTQIDIAEAKARVKPVVDSFCGKSANVKQIVDYFNTYRAQHKK
ncbi:MAG: TRAP transporter substrate-binding protein [Spirochaetales bacterium]|nr:TRAP transporter substrate-binding protein [Spirochaetales bacterium]